MAMWGRSKLAGHPSQHLYRKTPQVSEPNHEELRANRLGVLFLSHLFTRVTCEEKRKLRREALMNNYSAYVSPTRRHARAKLPTGQTANNIPNNECVFHNRLFIYGPAHGLYEGFQVFCRCAGGIIFNLRSLFPNLNLDLDRCGRLSLHPGFQ